MIGLVLTVTGRRIRIVILNLRTARSFPKSDIVVTPQGGFAAVAVNHSNEAVH